MIDRPEIIIASGGLKNSKGHDVYAALTGKALEEQGRRSATIPLEPQDLEAAGLPTKVLWGMIENGKATAGDLNPNSLLARGFHWLAGIARQSQLINSPLAYEFNERLAGLYERNGINTADILSSHYMAFTGTGLSSAPQTGRKILMGPDFQAHPQVAKYLSEGKIDTVFSPNPQYTNSLLVMGAPKEKILSWSPVLPNLIIDNAQSQLGHDPTKFNVLAAVGGSAVDAKQLEATVRHLVEEGHDVTVICGDNQPDKIELKRALSKFAACSSDHRASRLTLMGGTEGTTRSQEIAYLMWALGRPFNVALTRPNELAVIASALGFPSVLLDPFQPHEEQAHHHLISTGQAIAVDSDGSLPKDFEKFARERLKGNSGQGRQYHMRRSEELAALLT